MGRVEYTDGWMGESINEWMGAYMDTDWMIPCDLSMLRLKLNHVSKRGYCAHYCHILVFVKRYREIIYGYIFDRAWVTYRCASAKNQTPVRQR